MRNGDPMLSGEIECQGCGKSHDVIVLPVNSRNAKAPAWRVMKPRERDDDRRGGYRRDGDRDGGRGEYPSERGGSRRYEGRDDRDDRRGGGRNEPSQPSRRYDNDREPDWTRDEPRRGRSDDI